MLTLTVTVMRYDIKVQFLIDNHKITISLNNSLLV